MDIIDKKIKEFRRWRCSRRRLNNVKPHARGPQQARRRRELPGADAGQPKRQQSLAFRWILAAARAKKGKPMAHAAGG